MKTCCLYTEFEIQYHIQSIILDFACKNGQPASVYLWPNSSFDGMGGHMGPSFPMSTSCLIGAFSVWVQKYIQSGCKQTDQQYLITIIFEVMIDHTQIDALE